MMYNNFNGFQGGPFGPGMMGGGVFPVFGAGILLLILWSFIWKGLALWHSARQNHPWWFVALLIINTAGILEIIYLFAVLKLKLSELLPVSYAKKEPVENQ
ncbi:MAG: DUF5652 family protein [Patescibacteria group bacterium]